MKSSFFSANRRAIAKVADGCIVLTAHQQVQAAADSAQPFRQESNFWWLTGINEPGWVLIIDSAAGKEYLMSPQISDAHRLFDGGLSFDEARGVSGIDTIMTEREGKALIERLSEEYDSVHTLGRDPRAGAYGFALNPAPEKLRRVLKKQFKEIVDCRPILASLRAIKQPEEIAAIRSAVALTAEAFGRVKASISTLKTEYRVEAEYTHHFRTHNAVHAYEPIVAAGKNACTLHYIENKDSLASGQLVLLDVGARVDGYAADITRTYAIGTPTDRQREVHAAVEKAHHEIIALLKPGLSVKSYIEQVDEIMKEALDELDLLKTPDDYRRYFPHAISHGLGIDVHDSLGGPEKFLPGMVLTVEPGIYIPEEGIGVRIEDDVLITEVGHENLSASLSTSL